MKGFEITRKRSHPRYWELDCGANDAPDTEFVELEPALAAPESPPPSAFEFFQDLVKSCSHSSGDGTSCNLSYLRESELLHIYRIESKTQWEVYRAKKRKLITKLQKARASGSASHQVGTAPDSIDVGPPFRTAGVQEFLEWEKFDAEAGEAFLFHGVKSESAAFEIGENGFLSHLAKPGNFGTGYYVSDEFCKAAHYANKGAQKKGAGAAAVLLCRVSLGHPFQVKAEQRRSKARRPPRKCACTLPSCECQCREYYDSVVARIDALFATPAGSLATQGLHREIVVYDPDVVYPEFLFVLRPLIPAAPTPPPPRVGGGPPTHFAQPTSRFPRPTLPSSLPPTSSSSASGSSGHRGRWQDLTRFFHADKRFLGALLTGLIVCPLWSLLCPVMIAALQSLDVVAFAIGLSGPPIRSTASDPVRLAIWLFLCTVYFLRVPYMIRVVHVSRDHMQGGK